MSIEDRLIDIETALGELATEVDALKGQLLMDAKFCVEQVIDFLELEKCPTCNETEQ